MTLRALKALLATLPEDCMELELMIDANGLAAPVAIILIDPPGNLLGVKPQVSFSAWRYGEENDEIIAKMGDRL